MSRSRITVDREKLDEHWIELPDEITDAYERLAEARAAHDHAKAKLDVVKAEAEFDIRRRPKHYGLTRPVREASVKVAVVIHELVQKQGRRLIACKLEVGMLEALTKGLETKKKSVENLTDMEAREWWSSPISKSARRDKFEAMRQDKLKNVRNKRRERRKDDD